MTWPDQELQAHKFILYARSLVFKAMFQSDMVEGGAGDDLAGAWRSQFGRELNKYKSKECCEAWPGLGGQSKEWKTSSTSSHPDGCSLCTLSAAR